MRFKVDCYENQRVLVAGYERQPDDPLSMGEEDVDWIRASPFRRIATFEVEASSSQEAADQAWAIGNDPWEPEDCLGAVWPHKTRRSMCSGDVVIVHTPDGEVGYACLALGWKAIPPHLQVAEPV